MKQIIVLDVETSYKNTQGGLLSIGAILLETGQSFYKECRLREGALVSNVALQINGITLEEANDPSKPSDEEIYMDFVKWAQDVTGLKESVAVIAGHNVGSFDAAFLKEIDARLQGKYGAPAFEELFGYRFLDLHSMYFAHTGESLSMPEICDKLGVEREPKPHKAINGAAVEAECIRKIIGA